MAAVPPRGSVQSPRTGCPYQAYDPVGELKCGAAEVVGEYLPGLGSGYLSELCFDTAGNWIDCVYFKRAMLL
jgi:hypothetical protein